MIYGLEIKYDEINSILVSGVFKGKVDFNPIGDPHNEYSKSRAIFLASYNSDLELKWIKKNEGFNWGYSTSNFRKFKILNEDEVLLSGSIYGGSDINPTDTVEEYD